MTYTREDLFIGLEFMVYETKYKIDELTNNNVHFLELNNKNKKVNEYNYTVISVLDSFNKGQWKPINIGHYDIF